MEKKLITPVLGSLRNLIDKNNQTAEVNQSVRLNGGKPLSLGANITFSVAPLKKETLDAFQKTKEFKNMPKGLGEFIAKADGAMMKWLSDKDNALQFTTNPLQAISKAMGANRIAIPGEISAHIEKLKNIHQNYNPMVPGLKIKEVRTEVVKK